MSDLEHARDLLARARKDFHALGNMLDADKFDGAIFGYVAQQAVEKSLKAWLAASGREYPFRHDLGELLETLAQAGENVQPFRNLVVLTPFAVQFRYDETEFRDLPKSRQEIVRDIGVLLAAADAKVKRGN